MSDENCLEILTSMNLILQLHYDLSPGHDVYGFYLKPPNMETGVKYPCVLFVYGGPHVQVKRFGGLNGNKKWILSSEI